MSAPKCRLCQSTRVKSLFLKDGIPYYACYACDFVFSTPIENANFQDELVDYEPAYLDYLEVSDEDAHNMERLLDWAGRYGPITDGKVLDVGSGSGKFVLYLRELGIDAIGLEPSHPLFDRYLKQHNCFFENTADGFAEEHRNEFDYIFACDVVEHINRPDQFLEAAARLIRPPGVLFVSTPDVGSLLARLSGHRWHYYNRYHLSYFSRKTLAPLAASQGFEEIAFDRLPRMKSIRYLTKYVNDFMSSASSLRLPERLSDVVVPVNLHDTMYLAFKFIA